MTEVNHLSELDVEALATGRPELVHADLRRHADSCEACQGSVRLARILAGSVSHNLSSLQLPGLNFEAMIMKAMAVRPVGFDLKDRTNRILLGVVTLVTVCSGAVSLSHASMPQLTSVTRNFFAVRGLMEHLGGPAVVALLGLVMLAGLVGTGVWMERALSRAGVKS